MSGNFFGIENFERDSGLMIVTFSAPASEFVTCGTAVNGRPMLENMGVDTLVRMNIFVREMQAGNVRVRVNARYVIAAIAANTGTLNLNTGGSAPWKWNVLSNPATCVPTHKAEKMVLDGIRLALAPDRA